MAKRLFKSEIISSAVGAARTGIATISGETWANVQQALNGLNTKVEARVRALRSNGGTVLTARPYINVISPTASVADNAGLSSTDLSIPDEVYMAASAPGTPHSYKLWLDTSVTPAIPKRWTGSTWVRLKGGLTNKGVWTSGTVYEVDDIVTYLGSAYFSITNHTSTATPPSSDTTNYSILVEKGATGAGAGGAHAATHKGDGSDPIDVATTTVAGLLSSTDKTKLNGLTSDHGGLGGLTDDDHTQYATADGSRLTLATSVGSPVTRQLRSNSGVVEMWDGAAWVPVQADLSPTDIVPKAQLGDLDIDEDDIATGRSVIINTTSVTHATDVPTAIEGQVIYETDTENLLVNVSEVVGTPDWRGLVPEAATYTPPFAEQSGANSLFVAYGTGDPALAYSMQTQALANGPIATQILPTVIRLVKFRVPKTLALSGAQIIGLGSSPNIWRVGIYRVSDGVKMYDSGLFQFANGKILTITGVTLAPDTPYFYAFSTTSATDTGVYFKSPATPYYPHFATGSGMDTPDVGQPAMYSHATTGGVLPTTLTAPGASTWGVNSGSLPFLWLRGSAS